MTRPSAVLCALLLSSATSARAEKTPVYALTGGRVVTVSGPIQEGATVVLRDGVVEAVGSGVKIPADARVIDAKGLTLTPGLIDGFGGIGLPAAGPPRGAGWRRRRQPAGAARRHARSPDAGARQDPRGRCAEGARQRRSRPRS
mgnify:CR=1 FL=1